MGTGTLGALITGIFNTSGVFCIVFGFTAALISIVTIGSCVCFIFVSPYPEFIPFLLFVEAELEFVENFKFSYFSLKGETTLSKVFKLLVNTPSNGYFSVLSPLPLYVPFHLLYI